MWHTYMCVILHIAGINSTGNGSQKSSENEFVLAQADMVTFPTNVSSEVKILQLCFSFASTVTYCLSTEVTMFYNVQSFIIFQEDFALISPKLHRFCAHHFAHKAF